MFFPGDLPNVPPRTTVASPSTSWPRSKQPANLDKWPDPQGRLITIILIRCGLRATDACTLPFDCLLHDGRGAPYLRYFNNKMSREAAVPIDEELENEIRAQQQRVLRRWPDGSHTCSPPTSNATGQRPFAASTYRGMLNRWLTSCEVRDEHGRPVHLTPTNGGTPSPAD